MFYFFYTLFNEEASFYNQRVRRHHFIGNFGEDARLANPKAKNECDQPQKISEEMSVKKGYM